MYGRELAAQMNKEPLVCVISSIALNMLSAYVDFLDMGRADHLPTTGPLACFLNTHTIEISRYILSISPTSL
jgi:hypothetical protein